MRTYAATTVTVGSGRSIHWGSDCGTICGAAHRSGRFTQPKLVAAETATCQRCIRIMATQVEEAHAAALLIAEVEAARTEALNEEAQRRDDAMRAEDLAAPSANHPAAVALDTWLTQGLVLVGPATDTLYVFERWDGGTAVLTSVSTGDVELVAQADITNWRYLPGIKTREVRAGEVGSGDVVLFHAGGVFRTVATRTGHTGTDLVSFGVLSSAIQFVRDRAEVVTMLDMPRVDLDAPAR